MTKQPRIESNEGKPDKFVRILATVVNRPDSTFPLVIKPYKLDISQFSEKKRDTMRFNITNMSDKPLELSTIFSPNDFFELKLPKVIGPNETAHGSIKLKKSSIDKAFEKSFTIEVNDESKSRFTIPVKRSLKNAAPATPETVGSVGGH